jgi:hypothetical protein
MVPMKRYLIVFMLSFLSINLFSQSEYRIYQSIKPKVVPYLDSIAKIYYENSYHEGPMAKYQKDPYSILSTRVFGNNIRLLNAPNDSSDTVEKLTTGETVYYPYFLNEEIQSHNIQRADFCFRLDDIGDGMGKIGVYRFVFLKNGTLGFINETELYGNMLSFPDKDLLFIQEGEKKAILKSDYSQSFFFYPIDFEFSKGNNYLTYSSSYEEDSSFVYLYDVNKWENRRIGFGNNPSFADQKIIYGSGLYKDINVEEIHSYNIDNRKDTVFYIVPDTLTLWSCGGDYCNPVKIGSLRSEKSTCYKFTLFAKNNSLMYHLTISSRGETLKIQKEERTDY